MADASGPILVPLDGSKIAENAVPVAAQLSRAWARPVSFFHVLEQSDTVIAPQDTDRARSAFIPYALHLGEKAGLGPSDQSADIGWGPAAPTILAASEGAAAIVIASHGRGGFRSMFIGSVADKVVRGADVPVLVVPGIESPVAIDAGPVLVAVDGSAEAERGLTAARDLAGRLGSELVLVRAYNVPPPVGAEFAYYPPDVLESVQQGAEEYLAQSAQPGERTVLAQGQAAQVIEESAEQLGAGLIVMTSRGKGLAARITLGSTTDRVMHAVERPLLVIPVPDE
ncbi:MAG TPA: universal stress protein [Tepidiformaceae bacterium]